MENGPALIAVATVLGGAYLLMRGMQQQQGSGQGLITTDNTTEGSILDTNGIANQITAAATPSPTTNPTT